jgi:hypothetical protein
MTTFNLAELQHSNDREGLWKLYIFEKDSNFHRGGVWFAERPKYPEEGEITTVEAEKRCIAAVLDGREVRVCDCGDMLVYHFDGRNVLHGFNFWNEVIS